MARLRLGAVVGGFLALVSTTVCAESDFLGLKLKDNLALGVTASTTGFGPELQVRVLPRLVLRGGYNWFQFGVDDEYDGIDYDADLNLSNFIVGANIHPFKNGFFIGGGAFIGDKSVDLTATSSDGTLEIGDEVFDAADVGTLNGEVELRQVAPFAGLGYDNTFSGGRLGFKAMVGVLFTGSPDATLTADGALADDPDFNAQLENEVQSLEDDIEDFKLYPLLSLGLSVRL